MKEKTMEHERGNGTNCSSWYLNSTERFGKKTGGI